MPRNRSEKEQALSRDGLLALKAIRASSEPEQATVNNYFRERISGVHRDEPVWRKHWDAIDEELRFTIVELPLSERRRLYGVLST